MSKVISVPDTTILEEDCNVPCKENCKGEGNVPPLNVTVSLVNNETSRLVNTGAWEKHKGRCYLWSQEKLNWTDAEMACR